MLTPLNGTKTHPLTKHAKDVLRYLADGPCPAQVINPGVINRLEREDLAERYLYQTPYPMGVKGKINWLRITEAGRERLASLTE